VRALIVRRDIAAAAHHIFTLAHTVGPKKHTRAHRIARTFGPSNELQFHPVMVVGFTFLKQYRWTVDGVDHDIDLALVEQVAKRGRRAQRSTPPTPIP